jgi:xanthine dehydrogenase YagS FAD-binding subunit
VNLKTIPGLSEIRHRGGLRLGALVTLSDIEHHPGVLEKFSFLAQAASLAATRQLRNTGTVAGNLCQHPRCWYYRSPLFHCWLKGGEKCFAFEGENKYHAILGGGPCHAVHPSDLAPALIALNAKVQLTGPARKREMSLEELYAKPKRDHRQMTVLGPGELIREIQIPIPSKKSRGIYLKEMERRAWSFALVSVAAHVTFEGDRMAEVDIVMGGVAPVPWRAKEAEKVLTGEKVSAVVAKAAGEAAVVAAKPLRDNEYKVNLAKELIKKALAELAVER